MCNQCLSVEQFERRYSPQSLTRVCAVLLMARRDPPDKTQNGKVCNCVYSCVDVCYSVASSSLWIGCERRGHMWRPVSASASVCVTLVRRWPKLNLIHLLILFPSMTLHMAQCDWGVTETFQMTAPLVQAVI